MKDDGLPRLFWMFKMAKKISKEKLYNLWAKEYDSWPSVRTILLEKEFKNIIKNIKNKKVLDLGCGTGIWSIKLASTGGIVTAVDNSKQMLEIFKNKLKKLKKCRIKITNQDINKLKINKKFNLIIMFLVDSHIKNLSPIFKFAREHLNEKGIFMMASPIYFSNIKKPTKKEILIMKNKYKINYYAHPKEEIKLLAKKNGLTIKKIKKIFVNKSVKEIFDRKPHKPFSKEKGKHYLTIYKFKLK